MKYIRYITIILVLALFMLPVETRAAEAGTINTMSEKIYEGMNLGSNVIGNVIQNEKFELISMQTDENGNEWYLIETKTGTRAESVQIAAQNTQNDENENRQPESAENDDYEHPSKVRALQIVNVRTGPSLESERAGRASKDTVFDCIGSCVNEIGEVWYEVVYNDISGYVRDSTVEVVGENTVATVNADNAGETGNTVNLDNAEDTENDVNVDNTDIMDIGNDINSDNVIDIENIENTDNVETTENIADIEGKAEINDMAEKEAEKDEDLSAVDITVVAAVDNDSDAVKHSNHLKINVMMILSVIVMIVCLVVLSQLIKRLFIIYKDNKFKG